MYIGRATSQKLPVGASQPATSARLESVTIQSFNFILNLLCHLLGLYASLSLLVLDVRDAGAPAAKPNRRKAYDPDKRCVDPVHHLR